MKLEGKIVVITGSTRGIGRAIARACAVEGAAVIVSSRREAAVEETCDVLRRQGARVSGVVADVSVPSDLEGLLRHAVGAWGRVDVWINNAGLSAGMRPLGELSAEEIAEIVNVNLTGTLQACRLVIPHLIAQGGGIVINLGGRGSRGEAAPFLTTYAATKAAVASLTCSLAQEYRGDPVSIHAVIPGMVATDFYVDIQVSPKLAASAESIPYVLDAFGMPLDVVGRAVAEIAAQTPGKVTGKVYSLLGGGRMLRGAARMMWYRVTGKLRGGT